MSALVAFTLAGAVTWGLRASFVLAGQRVNIPVRAERALADSRPAILASLVGAALTTPSGAILWFSTPPTWLVAAVVAAAVAHRTRSVPATSVAGMGTLWMLTLVSG